MKRIIALACFVMIILCGCTLFQKDTPDKTKNDTKSEAVVEQKPNGQIVSEVYGTGYGSWQSAYAKYIDEKGEGFSGYSLIYVDDDDVPELYLYGCCEAAGDRIATYDESKDCLSFMHFGRLGLAYIPNTGLMYKNSGHMDYYPVYVYQLYKGDVYLLGEGLYGGLDRVNGKMQLDENGYPIYQYEWEGNRCTEEDFYKNIKELFDTDKGIYARDEYSIEQILSLLKTGSV